MWCGVQRELDVLLRGVGEEWTAEGVLDAIKCDHGYSASSPTVLAFVAALTDLSAEERRALLRFVTGSPRLPPGGLAALRPRLTIVKKHAHGPGALLHAPPFFQQVAKKRIECLFSFRVNCSGFFPSVRAVLGLSLIHI